MSWADQVERLYTPKVEKINRAAVIREHLSKHGILSSSQLASLFTDRNSRQLTYQTLKRMLTKGEVRHWKGNARRECGHWGLA